MLNKNVLNERKEKDELDTQMKSVSWMSPKQIPLASRWGHSVSPLASLEQNVGVANLQF